MTISLLTTSCQRIAQTSSRPVEKTSASLCTQILKRTFYNQSKENRKLTPIQKYFLIKAGVGGIVGFMLSGEDAKDPMDLVIKKSIGTVGGAVLGVTSMVWMPAYLISKTCRD